MSETNTKLIIESADTDSIRTATVLRLVFEGPPTIVEAAAELLLAGLNATVTKATSVAADGERQDITSEFVRSKIDPLDTGDTSGV